MKSFFEEIECKKSEEIVEKYRNSSEVKSLEKSIIVQKKNNKKFEKKKLRPLHIYT